MAHCPQPPPPLFRVDSGRGGLPLVLRLEVCLALLPHGREVLAARVLPAQRLQLLPLKLEASVGNLGVGPKHAHVGHGLISLGIVELQGTNDIPRISATCTCLGIVVPNRANFDAANVPPNVEGC
jgi:hypothetical protein